MFSKDNMDLIDKACEIANIAHWGQKDKGGKDYILHPLHIAFSLMDELENSNNNENYISIVVATAILHDTVEDTTTTLKELSSLGIPEEVIEPLKALTRGEDENYEDYILRVKQNEIATLVKKHDLLHNMDLRRIPIPTEYELKRKERYKKALNVLTS